MIRKKIVLITIMVFLAQAFPLAGILSAESYVPTPLTEIRVDGANPSFKETCNVLCMALSIYRSDVFNKLHKEELIKLYGPMLSDSIVRFDLERIDFKKKGWTRYYPFSVGERKFIARIFLTRESAFQPKVTVLSEMVVEKFGVTLQLLPGLEEILSDCKIKPNKIYSSSQADKSA